MVVNFQPPYLVIYILNSMVISLLVINWPDAHEATLESS